MSSYKIEEKKISNLPGGLGAGLGGIGLLGLGGVGRLGLDPEPLRFATNFYTIK